MRVVGATTQRYGLAIHTGILSVVSRPRGALGNQVGQVLVCCAFLCDHEGIP